MVISGSCQESTPSTQERGTKMRRKRFQKGSLQARKHGRHRVWVAVWWEDGSRRSKVLGRCSQMSKAEAESALSAMLRDINSGVTRMAKPVYTFEQFINGVYLPFCRRSWKESTAGTSEQIVKSHLIPEFGKQLLHAIRREELQDFLDRKALDLSSSPVAHLRWFLSGVFKLAVSDGLMLKNPAAELRIPRKCQPGRDMRPAYGRGGEYVSGGLRPPGEVGREARNLRRYAARRDPGASVEIGSRRSDPGGGARLQAGVQHAEERQDPRGRDVGRHARVVKGVGRAGTGPVAGWVRVSLGEDRDAGVAGQSVAAAHAAEADGHRLGLGDVQVLRKTNASLSKKAGVDPKVASDQRGHGLGVSMEVYTSSDMEQKRAALKKLEAAVLRKPQPQQPSELAKSA